MDSVLFFGPPCGGKGTAGKLIIEAYPQFTYVASGDLCRAAKENNHPLIEQMVTYDRAGTIWPDALIVSLIEDHMKGFQGGPLILDGFPRTIPQAEYWDDHSKVRAVYNFTNLTGEVLERRRQKRVAENAAIGVYRPEDEPEAFKHRVKVFYSDTLRTLRHYIGKTPIIHVNARASPEEMAAQISADLEQRLRI